MNDAQANDAQAQRPAAQLAPPTLLSDAFDNPEEVLELIERSSNSSHWHAET